MQISIGALALTLAEATTPTGVAKRLLLALQQPLGARWLELRHGASALRVEADGERPRATQLADAPGAPLLQLDPEAAQRLAPEAAEALTQVVEAALLGCERLRRVADSARPSHQLAGDELRRARLVARSPAMQRLLGDLDAVAPHATSVLLLGETGTGKERLAERLHRRSGRRGALVKLNCGAIPPELIESELFGHEAGAFTGARARRRGRFERADGGTLLLDEVGELPPAAQVRLLRVLQEGELERVGGEQTLRVDVRVVAATHRELPALIADGQFREDLYYRLAVVSLRVPPLRERAEDLPGLLAQLADETSSRLGVARPTWLEPDVAPLAALPWPGNIRQLANALERALLLAPEDPLAHIAERESGPPAHAPRSLDAELDALARRRIHEALTASQGQVYGPAGAAAALGLRPSTLQHRMRRLGIERDTFT